MKDTIRLNDLVIPRVDIGEHRLWAKQIYQVVEVFAPDEFAIQPGGVHLKRDQVVVLRDEAALEENTFWELMEEAKAESGDNVDHQVQLLVERLSAMPVADVFAYGEIFNHLQNLAYQRELWTAATILGSSGDDSFEDFRAWLIAQGRRTFYDVLHDPDKLADVVDPGPYGHVELEQMNYVDFYAYEKKFGEEMPLFSFMEPKSKLAGDWLDDALCEKFPKLMKKFRPDQCLDSAE